MTPAPSLKQCKNSENTRNKETSLQTKKKLEELDLQDVAQVLAKEGALAGAGGGRCSV